ncbi:MAG: 50S ribosomal protein L24 [Anaerolineaceae bacterium 4572_78]|nr:MAG: 50S ribosomal protein L24 [Anaerolineaceae bacterium 4572_78]
MQRIKKGDTVEVIAGNEVGFRGEVQEVVTAWKVNRYKQKVKRDYDSYRVVVSGVNMVKKHQRPVSQTRSQVGIIEFEAPIHISNVMLVCSACDEPSRIGFRIEESKKFRYCKRCGEAIV